MDSIRGVCTLRTVVAAGFENGRSTQIPHGPARHCTVTITTQSRSLLAHEHCRSNETRTYTVDIATSAPQSLGSVAGIELDFLTAFGIAG